MCQPQTIASQKQLDLIAKLVSKNLASSRWADWCADIVGDDHASEPLPLTKVAASCLIDLLMGKTDGSPRLAAWSIRTWREEDPGAYQAEYDRMAANGAAFDVAAAKVDSASLN